MSGFWLGFWSGLIAGFLANLSFYIVIRLIALRYSKYQVELDDLIKSGDDRYNKLLSAVRIKSPCLSRAFVDPLKEYLCAEVLLDNKQSIPGLWWPENAFRLLANGDMTAFILILNKFTGLVTLGADDKLNVEDGKHLISVKIMRSVDNTVVAEREYDVVIDKRQIIVA